MSKSAFTDAYATVVGTLRALREGQGVSQVELARRLGRNQQFVSYVETGVRRLDLVEFVVIVRALGLDPQKVFGQLLGNLGEDTRI